MRSPRSGYSLSRASKSCTTSRRATARRKFEPHGSCRNPEAGPPLTPPNHMPNVVLRATLLLIASNVFMTFAWYAHLRNLGDRKWYIAALVSWGIALFEYLLQVPANRIGYTALTLPQLKILQEVITLSVFVPFAILYMRQQLPLDVVWAGLGLGGAVYFMFRGTGHA